MHFLDLLTFVATIQIPFVGFADICCHNKLPTKKIKIHIKNILLHAYLPATDSSLHATASPPGSAEDAIMTTPYYHTYRYSIQLGSTYLRMYYVL
jgi:hypothetical protein